MSLRSLVLTSLAAFAVTASAHATTFGLEGSIGKTPTFSVSSGGITATFTSTAGNSFAVQDTTSLFTFNTALLDNSYGADPLTITFSSPVSGTIVIPFAFLDIFSTTDSMTVTANTGQTAGFPATLDAFVFAEPEGIATLSLAAPVTSLTLTGTSAFGIGDFGTVASTPEPTSIVLLATGLAGMIVRRRRA